MAKVEAPRPHTMSLYHQSSRKKYDANKLNAQKSTGPRTPEGKRRSSLNGIKKRQLKAELSIEGPEAAQREADLIDIQVQAKNAYQRQIRDRLALTTCRLSRARIVELRIVQDAAIRAQDFWDVDRAAEAASLGSKIHRDPSRVYKTLLQSKHGCEWLIEQWGFVREAVKETRDDIKGYGDKLPKSAPQLHPKTVSLASRLAGRGPGAEFRSRTVMEEGFIDGHVRKVEEVLASHLKDDRRRRVLAMAGQDDRKVEGLTAARRHESTMIRYARWLVHMLNQPESEGRPEMGHRAQYFRDPLDPEHYSTGKHTPYTEQGEVDLRFNPEWDRTDFDTHEAIEERRQADEFARSPDGRAMLLDDKRAATRLTKKREAGEKLSIPERNLLDESLRQMDYAPEDVRDDLELGWLDLDTPDEDLADPANPPTIDEKTATETIADKPVSETPAPAEPKAEPRPAKLNHWAQCLINLRANGGVAPIPPTEPTAEPRPDPSPVEPPKSADK